MIFMNALGAAPLQSDQPEKTSKSPKVAFLGGIFPPIFDPKIEASPPTSSDLQENRAAAQISPSMGHSLTHPYDKVCGIPTH
jgi:hypothetical protein